MTRLQAALASAANVTVASLLRETEEARLLAQSNDNASAMVSATTLKAKLCGLLVEKTEDLVARRKLEADMAQLGEVRKAADWIGDALESYDLPPTATPVQLIGAASRHAVHEWSCSG